MMQKSAEIKAQRKLIEIKHLEKELYEKTLSSQIDLMRKKYNIECTCELKECYECGHFTRTDGDCPRCSDRSFRQGYTTYYEEAEQNTIKFMESRGCFELKKS